MPEWAFARLDSLVRLPQGQVDPRAEPYRSMIHVGPENIESGTGCLSGLRTAGELRLVSGKYLFDERAILYSKIRPNLNKVCRPGFSGLCSADVYPIWADGDVIDPDYLRHYMMAPRFLAEATNRSGRTGLPKVNREDLGSICVPFPRDMAEQRRIVGILSTWDSAANMLKSLRSLRIAQRNWATRHLLAPRPGTFHRRTALGEITSAITSGSRGWAQYYVGDGDLFLRMTNLPREGVRLLMNDLMFVRLPESLREAQRTRVQRGDVLVSITAELGKIGFVDSDLGDAFVNQHLALLRPVPSKVNPEFLAHFLAAPPQRKRFQRLNDAGAKAGLNLKSVREFTVELPPRAEQDRIADALRNAGRELEILSSLGDCYRRQKSALGVALLREDGGRS